MTTPIQVAAKARQIMIMAFVGVTLALIVGGYFYYRQEVREIRDHAYQDLAAVGKLKATEIEQWRAERQEDAERLAHSSLMRKAVVDLLRQPDDVKLRAELRNHLKVEQQTGHDEDALLLAPDGTFLLAVKDDSNPLHPALQRAIATALTNQTAVISDFYRDHDGSVRIDSVAVVREADGRPIAVLVVRRDPRDYLYPLIQSWPMSSPSAETVLVQSEGTNVVFVNALRHATNAALDFRFPLSRTDLPAVQGVLGKQGMYVGEDYRGITVLADIRPISGSAWVMITKLDWDEATYEEFYRGVEIALIIGMFIALGLTGYFYHWRLTRIYLNFSDAEQRKLTAQEKYRATLYSIGDGVITTDTTGRVQEMNPVAQKLTGWSQPEAQGKPLAEIFRVISEVSREPVSNPVAEVLRNGEIFGLPDNALLIARDGVERNISDSAAPISDANGSMTGVVLVFSDQTRQHAAQQALKASEERWQFALEGAGDGVWDWNPQTDEVFYSQQWKAMLGYETHEIGADIGEWEQRIHPADLRLCREELEKHLRGEVPLYRNEHRMRCKDGSYKWILDRGKIVERTADGQPLRIIGTHTDISRRKAAEAELQASELAFSMAFHSSPASITLSTFTEGRFLDANAEFLRTVERERSEVIGHTAKELGIWIKPEQRDNMLAQLKEHGSVRGLEIQIRTKSGALCDVLWSAEKVVIGGQDCLLATSLDITERKQAEEERQASEARLRIVTENARVGLVMVNRERRYIYANTTYTEILGLPSSDIKGKYVAELLAPIYETQVRPRLDRAFAGERVVFELEMPGTDGNRFYLARYEPLKEGDSVSSVVVVITDITESKQSEAALFESEAEFRAVFEQAAVGMAQVALDGRWLRVNQRLCEIVGYSQAELLPRMFQDITHPDDLETDLALVRRLLAGELQTYTLEKRYFRKDGSVVPVNLTVALLRDASGRPDCFISVVEDIAKRKQTEQALLEAELFSRATIDALSAHLCVLDAHGTILTTNCAWDDFAAANSDPAHKINGGDNYLEVCRKVVGEDSAEAQHFMAGLHAVLGGERDAFEMEYGCHSSTEQRWFFARVTRFAGNGPLRVVVAHENITQRKQAEQALEHSRSLLRATLESTADGILVVDAQGKVASFNQKFLTMWQLPATLTPGGGDDRQIQMVLEQLAEPAAFLAKVDELYRHPEAISVDELKFRDGRTFERYSQPQRLGARTVGRVWSFRDITGRKQAEAALRRRAQILSALGLAAERFLSATAWRVTVPEVLANLGQATAVSRVVVWQAHSGPDGATAISQRFEWRANAVANRDDDPSLQNLPLVASGFARWGEVLGRGDVIQGLVRDFPASEQAALNYHHIIAIVVVPIMVNNEWWGFMAFDECTVERVWQPDEIEVLRAAARIFGEAIQREQAEATVRESERRFQSLFQNVSSVAIQSYAPDGTTQYWNQASAQLYGYTAAEALGRNLLDLIIPAEMQAAVQQAIQQMVATGQPIPASELTLRRKDGSEVTVFSSHAIVQTPGRPPELFCIDVDLTERKAAEAALQNSAAILYEAQRLAKLGNWEWNIKTGSQIWSPELFRIYGRDPELGPAEFQEILQYFTPESWAHLSAEVNSAITDGSTYECDAEVVRPDGTHRWITARGEVVRDASGKITGLHGTMQDITERKLTEESHTRLATAVEQAAESIMITDTRGTILYTNPAFEKTSRYNRAEAIGQNPRILNSGRQDTEFYHRMWTVLKRGEVWRGHFSNRRKDGILYEEEATISPIRDASGSIRNYVAVKRDVTREVQLEEQFRQSQKMEAFGQLAGGVAHDFNNILAVIQLQVGLLRSDESLPPTQMDYAAEIETACQRAASLTRQLLLFSRQQTPQPRDFDLNDAVANMTKMLHRIVGEDITMEIKYARGPQFVHADAGMLDQVLLNLTVNSRDAMPEGGRLSIETLRVDFDELAAPPMPPARPGAFVCLSVSDTGCGIAPEVQSRIFEPFFTTKDVGKGTGLGLATVFGIVQQHNGWINVQSEVGRGTTFRIFLPRLDKAPGQKSKAPALASVRGGDETILLVEDDSCLRNSVQKILARLGYRVVVADHGLEALRIWKEEHEKIRLVLTDLVMPGGMTGKDLAEILLRQNPKLKIIYASGYSAEAANKDLSLVEGVNFLSKPFESHMLAKAIRDCLDRS